MVIMKFSWRFFHYRSIRIYIHVLLVVFSVEECRNTLVQFGIREITPEAVARALGCMVRTPVGLSDQISIQVRESPFSYEGEMIL